jgi:hypothetical protein
VKARCDELLISGRGFGPDGRYNVVRDCLSKDSGFNQFLANSGVQRISYLQVLCKMILLQQKG